MSELIEQLRSELKDRAYREGYDEAFLDHRIATQIRVIREERPLTQSQLAKAAGMKQSRISAMEDEDYGSWSINTLRRIAYALGVRLKVEFVEWGDLLHDVEHSGREDLERKRFEEDPAFAPAKEMTMELAAAAFCLSTVTADLVVTPAPQAAREVEYKPMRLLPAPQQSVVITNVPPPTLMRKGVFTNV